MLGTDEDEALTKQFKCKKIYKFFGIDRCIEKKIFRFSSACSGVA